MSERSRPSLNNKVIVITGASSGAGRAAAIEFAKHQTMLVLAARNEQALAEAAGECEELGAKAIAVKTDVTDANSLKELAAAAIAFGGKIDVWVNNAGVLAVGELAETPVEIHAQVIRTNLIGFLYGAHAVLPYFKKQRQGLLINNISIGGWFPVPFGTGYSASKFGIRGFSEALRGELIKYPHIRICDLIPAFLDTPGVQHAGNFTGATLRPAPPVYDPMLVAKAMVKIVQRPKASVMVGAIAPLLRLAHFIAPALSRNITASVMSAYLKNAEASPHTSGNLFETVNYGTSIHGGWNLQTRISNRKKNTAMAAILVAAGLCLFAGLRSARK